MKYFTCSYTDNIPSDKNKLYIYMEKGYKDLWDLSIISNLTIDKWFLFYYKLFDAMNFLNDSNIVHGDLKGPNIMIDEKMNPKLIDWGGAEV